MQGYILSWLIVLIPSVGWMVGYDFSEMQWWQATAIFVAKTTAFAGIMLLALSLIMSGRHIAINKLFGGLDKMYKAHQRFGVWGTVAIFIHPLALSISRLDDGVLSAFSIWIGLPNIGVFLGAIALYLFILLVLWSKYARIKYETFTKVHRFLGLVFLLGAAHAFWVGSVISSNILIFWYLLFFTILATVTYLLYSIAGDVLHRQITYTVEEVKEHKDRIIEVVLQPKNRTIAFQPGQFVYVGFAGLEEMGFHPFSIASGKMQKKLRLIIRRTGDFTEEIKYLKKGTKAKVKGPYGGFLLLTSRHKKELWIAGGIGITPFLSGAYSKARSHNRSQIEMIYATADEVPFAVNELQIIEERDPGFNMTLFHQKTFGFVSLAILKEQIHDFDERDIYICGPPPMLKALVKEAHQMGIHHRLHYEEFSY